MILRSLLATLIVVASSAAVPPAQAASFTDADYEKHIKHLRKRVLPKRAYTILVEKPFVVVGDEAPSTVRARAAGTVRWAVTKLKARYFEKDPNHILTIYLFKDAKSYMWHAKKLFDDEPSTPYGYYSPAHRALVMNISTGGGTLVHEIVHPFMESNFPEVPAWFNEGMGSLYEQSSERNGIIWGLTNWRLTGLKEAITARKTIPFKRLTSTTDNQFYGDVTGMYYAQARYLCYYLQVKGLLQKYYKSFRAAQGTDKTGFKTLKKVLGEADMAAFQKRWETYVLGLKFPG
jgi:hypothetical protein